MTAPLPSRPSPPPVVGITCCRRVPDFWPIHSVGEKYVTAVSDAAGALPLLVPALGARLDVDMVLGQLDGLLLTGSPSNVEPHHYAGGAEPQGNKTDPERDATTLPLIRRAVDLGVPLLGLCRGIQEINVALGGSLHQQLHAVDGRFDHRSDKSKAPGERYAPRHRVRLMPGGLLATLLDAEAIEVNSLHGQGLDRLAPGLVVEAVADDGTIEAVRVEAADFALAVQWHPEFRPLTNRVSTLIFRAFGEAVQARARRRRAVDVV
jgi:putative glutamine amidotransferase